MPRRRFARTLSLALAGVCSGCFSPTGSNSSEATTSAATTGTTGADPSATGLPTTGTTTSQTVTSSSESTSTATSIDPSTLGPTTTEVTGLTEVTATTAITGTTDETATGTTSEETSMTASTTGQGPTCGDGSVDFNEQCDDGNDIDDDACSNLCEATKFLVVFVSSLELPGFALTTADAQCMTMAGKVQALAGRKFVAWLSAGRNFAAKDRIGNATLPYRRTDGVLVATSTDDLLDGTLVAPINVTEAKESVKVLENCQTGADVAWTGSTSDGNPAAEHCSMWTEMMGDGRVGGFGLDVAAWSDCSTRGCVQSHRIYCIEKAP